MPRLTSNNRFERIPYCTCTVKCPGLPQCMYVERERDRDRERDMYIHIYIYIYIRITSNTSGYYFSLPIVAGDIIFTCVYVHVQAPLQDFGWTCNTRYNLGLGFRV